MWQKLKVTHVQDESSVVRSFILEPVDKSPLRSHLPGQFITLQLPSQGDTKSRMRSYTISDSPNGKSYRISVKREAQGGVSDWLHSYAGIGQTLEAQTPAGEFVFNTPQQRPVVFISAGVGITPMIAMLNSIVLAPTSTVHEAPIYFFHAARNSETHAFRSHLANLRSQHSRLSVHVCYSKPEAGDELGVTHDSVGFIDVSLLKRLLPLDDYDFYLCGPTGFMQSLYDGLCSLGVRDERILFESFGPASVARNVTSTALKNDEDVEVAVGFSKSKLFLRSSINAETLLELAEKNGLSPKVGCRAGACGVCATRVLDGSVSYLKEPSFKTSDKQIALICCSRPGPKGVDLDI